MIYTIGNISQHQNSLKFLLQKSLYCQHAQENFPEDMKPFQHTFQVDILRVNLSSETDDQREMSLLEII